MKISTFSIKAGRFFKIEVGRLDMVLYLADAHCVLHFGEHPYHYNWFEMRLQELTGPKGSRILFRL